MCYYVFEELDVKVVVSDTSSLILLSKASVLEVASSNYEIYLPPSVEKIRPSTPWTVSHLAFRR